MVYRTDNCFCVLETTPLNLIIEVVMLSRLFLLAAALVLPAKSIYFYVQSGGERCFGEEAYAEAVIHVNYKHENHHGTVCSLTFFDNKGLVLLQRNLETPEGNVATVVPSDAPGGTYKVCLKCPGSRWTANEPQKFRIKIDVGGRSLLDASDSAAKADDMRSVESKTRSILERIQTLSRDSEYERVTESMSREESSKTNGRIKFLHIISIVLLIVISAIQALALKNYFRKEKLIF